MAAHARKAGKGVYILVVVTLAVLTIIIYRLRNVLSNSPTVYIYIAYSFSQCHHRVDALVILSRVRCVNVALVCWSCHVRFYR